MFFRVTTCDTVSANRACVLIEERWYTRSLKLPSVDFWIFTLLSIFIRGNFATKIYYQQIFPLLQRRLGEKHRLYRESFTSEELLETLLIIEIEKLLPRRITVYSYRSKDVFQTRFQTIAPRLLSSNNRRHLRERFSCILLSHLCLHWQTQRLWAAIKGRNSGSGNSGCEIGTVQAVQAS